MTARPFLKWAGGKTQLLPELLKRVPTNYGTYHEPFLGGGALFWALQPKVAVLSDANPILVATYKGVRDSVDYVIDALRDYSDHHDAEQFARVRSIVHVIDSDGATAARMIYLNKTCFNGLWRVNRAGRNNVPLGKFKSPPTICDAENLRACSRALQGVEILHLDFRKALQLVRPGSFVYLDPPYVPVSETANFVGYTAGGFGPTEQAELVRLSRALVEHGASVLLSNAGNDEVRRLYQGFRIEEVRARRNVNSDASKRGAVVEYLISGGNVNVGGGDAHGGAVAMT